MAAEAKTKADGLFRDRKFTDAIDAYGEAIDLDPSNKALYSNRAACQEKLLANLFGDEKKAKIEEGLEDARKCVALDAAWARGHQRRAAFCDLLVRVKDTRWLHCRVPTVLHKVLVCETSRA